MNTISHFLGLSILGSVVGDTLNPASVVGDTLNPASMKLRADVLRGVFDEDLIAGLFFTIHKRQILESDDRAEILPHLARLKDMIRAQLQQIIDHAVLNDEKQQQENLRQLQQQLRESNQPHPEGTVAELAKKYGISKSEVRRRKANGTL